MRQSNVILSGRTRELVPKDIARILQKLNVSQPVFAVPLNVPLTTARSWEQGKRKPSGAALRLLALARERPEILLAA